MKPVISVIIPLYNKGNSIESTLNSVLVQKTSVPFEIIVVDDGSVDDSAKIVTQLAEKNTQIVYFKQPNGGPSVARNTGIKLAQGEWIMGLDADDLLLPGGIEDLYQTSLKYPQINFVCANFLREKHIDFPFIKDGIVKNGFIGWIFQQIYPCQGAFIFRKKKIPDLLYNPQTRRYEDAEMLFYYFRKREPIAVSSAFVMQYRTAYSNASTSADISKDFVGKLDFSGKCFWEKIALADLLIKNSQIYPCIKKMYRKQVCFMHLARLIFFFLRVRNKCYHLFQGE